MTSVTRDVDARLRQLEESVRDLAACQHDLDRRLQALMNAVERLAGAGPGEPAPDAPRARKMASPARSEAPRSWVRRAARFALRGTVGSLRRLWQASDPSPAWDGTVRLAVAEEPATLPRLAAVVPAGLSPDALASLREGLLRQTDPDLTWLVWEPTSGALTCEAPLGAPAVSRTAEPGELASALDADYLWSVSPGASPPPTFVETVKLVLAAESPAFLIYDPPDGSARPEPWWVVARELWHPEDVLDPPALRRLARRRPRRILGKRIGASVGYRLLPRALLKSGEVRAKGPYVLPAGGEPRVVDHRLAPPEAPSPPALGSRRPALLVLLAAPLAGGLETTLGAVLADCAETARCLVVNEASQEVRDGARLRALERLTPYVYSLPEAFAEELWPSILDFLVARHGVDRLLYVGEAKDLGSAQGGSAQGVRLRARHPGLRLFHLLLPAPFGAPGSGRVAEEAAADFHLAVTGALERTLAEQRVPADKVRRLPCVVDLDPYRTGATPPERAAELRLELGLAKRAVVVTLWSDLVAERRPEDFAALAHRFRDDERFAFLMVGEGPLESQVADLRRLLDLPNLRLERPRLELADVLAASDVVCSMAEREPFPHVVLAALAAARPVVAAAVDDLPELLGDGPCGIVVPRPGDLDGFSAALEELAEASVRTRLGTNGRDAAARWPRPRRALAAWRAALDLSERGEGVAAVAHGDEP